MDILIKIIVGNLELKQEEFKSVAVISRLLLKAARIVDV
jgi:hypothetical protein